MMSIPKKVGVMSCSCVLWLGLSSAPLATVSLGSAPCADSKQGQPNPGKCDENIWQDIDTVQGYVLRVDFDNLLVYSSDGKKVNLHIDEHTEMSGYIGPGQHIEAKVNDQQHALSIRLIE